MYEVPGSGRHHRRAGSHGSGLSFTASDVRWFTGTALLPPALVLILFLPHALIWITLMLITALGALTFRLARQKGDRHYTSRPKPESVDKPREVFEIKILPSQEEVEAKIRAKARNLAILATISGAVLAFARHSQNQAAKSTLMHEEVDELLGLPGKRLGYGARYQENRPKQAWEQPVITGWNWRERQEQARRGYRPTDGEPHGGNGSWQDR